ncbi:MULTISPECIES: hypothetical protein [unclassified Streptomyces]|nr:MULTISPECIES: hypothetical protein [unclassified Streptomyces]
MARTMGFYRAGDIADSHSHGKPLTHHSAALHELGTASDSYERAVGVLAWQYVGAAVVLGTALKQRCLRGGPPLGVDEVERLCGEPTLGELRAALRVPTLHEAPFSDETQREFHERERAQLQESMEMVFGNAAFLRDFEKETPEDVVAGFLLSEVSPANMDPLYEGTLELLFPYAEGLPFEISFYLKHAHRPVG